VLVDVIIFVIFLVSTARIREAHVSIAERTYLLADPIHGVRDARNTVAVYTVKPVLDHVRAVYARPEIEMALGERQTHVAIMTNECI
jgi:hypothetical protein